MKKCLCFMLGVSLMVVGCRQNGAAEEDGFATRQVSGKRSFVVIGNEPFYPAGNVIGIENSYRLEWPEAGVLPAEAERELIEKCFGDSVSSTVEEAGERLLYCTWGYEEEMPEIQMLELRTDSVADTLQYTYGHLESVCEEYGGLATFVIKDETFTVGAAHGLYSVQYVTVDKGERRVLHLEDLVDTSRLGVVVKEAVRGLEENADVREALFDEYREAEEMPVGGDFYVDSTLGAITIVYQLYEVAPYASGIQSVVLPIGWLSERVSMTAYGRRLFGLEK